MRIVSPKTLLLLGALLLVGAALLGLLAPHYNITVEPNRIRPISGHGYITELDLPRSQTAEGRVGLRTLITGLHFSQLLSFGWSPFRIDSDREPNARSALRVFEEGKALPMPHALHADIIDNGLGRFSHWGNDLYFSSTDRSDPRTNGRRYTVTVQSQFAPRIFTALIGLGGLLTALAVLLYAVTARRAIGALLTSPITYRATCTALLCCPIAVIAWHFVPPSIEITIPPEQVNHQSGNSYTWEVPLGSLWTRVASDDSRNTKRSALRVREDGRKLTGAHALHNEVDRFGEGRFSHWQDQLIFSASDNTDIRTNGRSYQVETELLPGPLWYYGAAFALACWLILVGRRLENLRWLVRSLCALLVVAAAAATIARFVPVVATVELPWNEVTQTSPHRSYPELTIVKHNLKYLYAPFIEYNLEALEHKRRTALTIGDGAPLLTMIKDVDSYSKWNPETHFIIGPEDIRFGFRGVLSGASDNALLFTVPLTVTKGGITLLWFGVALLTWSVLRFNCYQSTATPRCRLVTEPVAIIGVVLTLANCIGIFFPLGAENVDKLEKRGPKDQTITWSDVRSQLDQLSQTPDQERRILDAAEIVSSRINHNWSYPDLDELRMQVPLWHNWILWFRGELLPTFRRYNFADPLLALERGVGNCGQASMALVGVLQAANIETKILGLVGHTMVWAKSPNGQEYILDPDYGVSYKGPFSEFIKDPSFIARYQDAFTRMQMPNEKRQVHIDLVTKAIGRAPPTFSVVSRFHGNVDFETLSYQMKWWVPLLLLLPYGGILALTRICLPRPLEAALG